LYKIKNVIEDTIQNQRIEITKKGFSGCKIFFEGKLKTELVSKHSGFGSGSPLTGGISHLDLIYKGVQKALKII
jgi:hypothetical protein